MKPHYVTSWKLWKALGEEYGFDPYENVDFGLDIGGGNSIDYEFCGDPPEKEKVAEDWIAGEPYWPKTPKSKEGEMSKLSEGEVLKQLNLFKEAYLLEACRIANIEKELTPHEKQAYQQMVEMIQKPEVTEEWYDEKANELNGEVLSLKPFSWDTRIQKYRDFIRSLVKEIK